jgi:hypothetical protein
MINGIQNIIANPTFYTLTQGTASQMAIKTGLNAVARPGFILMDNNIDSHTKKFSATKEFLYQSINLALYMGLIIPVFKKSAFAMAKKIYKGEPILHAFKTPEEFKAFRKMTEENKVEKLAELTKNSKTGDVFTRENINKDSEDFATGILETSSLVGTVLGMAIIAPMTASKLIHPIMKGLGMTKDKPVEKEQPKTEAPKTNTKEAKVEKN